MSRVLLAIQQQAGFQGQLLGPCAQGLPASSGQVLHASHALVGPVVEGVDVKVVVVVLVVWVVADAITVGGF